jgi:hypothetical protein
MNPILDFENATDHETAVKAMQRAINNGTVWHMQGSMGRAAMDMIRAGDCVLGTKAHRDYWGNIVPSRFDVKPGTVGSLEYQKKVCREREEF